MFPVYANNISYTLSAAISSSDTSFVVDPGGPSFPAADPAKGEVLWFTLTNPAAPSSTEIIRVSAYNSDTRTVTCKRGAAVDWAAGTKMSLNLLASSIQRFVSAGGDGGDGNGGFLRLPDSGGAGLLGRLRLTDQGAEALSGNPMLSARAACEMVFTSRIVDLGVPLTWAASTDYSIFSVVAPSTPNGKQYGVTSSPEGFIDLGYFLRSDYVYKSSATEPDWGETTDEDRPLTNAWGDEIYGHWTEIDLSTKVNVLTPSMVVTEVGFIAYSSDVTAKPYVSIGANNTETTFANNVQLSQITGIYGGVHRILVPVGAQPIYSFTFKLETAATGNPFTGRFYWKGFCL